MHYFNKYHPNTQPNRDKIYILFLGFTQAGESYEEYKKRINFLSMYDCYNIILNPIINYCIRIMSLIFYNILNNIN